MVRESLSLISWCLIQFLNGLAATISRWWLTILSQEFLPQHSSTRRLDESIWWQVFLDFLDEIAIKISGGVSIDPLVVFFVELNDRLALIQMEFLFDLGFLP